ncbi:MAG TPA: hypothetical protein VFV95_06760 [Vicinamibacterales bacterium]|nr:hypothetical protein [Vicinamibacterales bacterium]
MRYELLFVPTSAVTPNRATFERYFSKRDNYAVTKGTARYTNEDTGVDFLFECLPETSGGPSSRQPWARFSLAYVRPSFFVEEATRELEPFTGQFGSSVVDLQNPAVTTFSTPALLKGWEAGNREACGPYPRRNVADAPLTLPRSRLLAAWQWNYRRKALQEGERDGLFVPKIWFIRTNDTVATGVIWPDAMPLRAPKVDYVIFSREMLAPRGLVGKRSDVAVVRWSQISPLVTGDAFYDSPLVSWRVTDPLVLTGLAQTVHRLPANEMPPLVPPDKVLDREGFAD